MAASENRLRPWSLADFALPGLLGNLKDFGAEFDDTALDARALRRSRHRFSLGVAYQGCRDLCSIDIPQVVAMTRTMPRCTKRAPPSRGGIWRNRLGFASETPCSVRTRSWLTVDRRPLR
jgi:hypothetical protein